MTNGNPLGATRIIIGVDTHRDERAAAAIDRLDAHWVSTGYRLLPVATKVYTSQSQGCRSGRGQVRLREWA